MPSDITLCIPSIPPREQLLQRAIKSVLDQTLPPDLFIVAVDHEKNGAPQTRQSALDRVDTEWVAFLDDDDVLYPDHLSRLKAAAVYTDADLIYPWFDVVGGSDPFSECFGVPWSDDAPHQVPITFLVRTEAIRACDGFVDHLDGLDVGTDPLGNRAGEDYRLILRLVKNHFKIVHLPERTWAWYHNTQNTSGLPSRW